jgi:ABC transporter substrate binding protein
MGADQHPGGNITGLSIQQTDLAAKKLELLREAVPDFRRLAILANVGSPASVLEKDEVEAAARTFSLDVVPVEIRRAEDLVSAFLALKGRAEALYVCGDALITNNRIRIITLAAGDASHQVRVRDQSEDGEETRLGCAVGTVRRRRRGDRITGVLCCAAYVSSWHDLRRADHRWICPSMGVKRSCRLRSRNDARPKAVIGRIEIPQCSGRVRVR